MLRMLVMIKTWLHISANILKNPLLIGFGLFAWRYMNNVDSHSQIFLTLLEKSRNSNRQNPMNYEGSLRQRRRLVDLLATVHPKQPRCLVKTLILAQWLQKQNIAYELKIGWKKTNIAHSY